MSLFRKGLHIAGRQLVIVAGVVAALILLLIGSGAWLSDAVAQRKDEIATWAGERSGYQIEIGEAGLYWLDFLPKLMLSNVTVLTPDSQRPVVEFDTLYVGIDLFNSIEARQAVIDSASISGLRLGVKRDANGQFSVRDLNWRLDDKTSNDKQWQAALAGLEQLQLQDAEVSYQDALRPKLSGHYQLHQVIFNQSGNWLAADVDLTLPQQLGQQLLLSGEIRRDGDNWPEWQVTVDGSQLQLATFLVGQKFSGVALEQGRGDLRVTASKQADNLIANGLLRLQSSHFVRITENHSETDVSVPPLIVDYLDTEFNWMQQGDGWQLDLKSLDLQVNGEAWPETQLRASHDPAQGSQLQSNYLRLSDLSAAAALIDAAPDWLKASAPVGDVSDLQLTVDKDHTIQQVQATVAELGLQENGDIPGVSGLSFILDWNAGLVDVQLDSQEVAVYASNWLPETLYLDSLDGKLQWQLAPQGGQLNVTQLQILNEDMNATLSGSYRRGEPQRADISLALADFNVASWLNYVPERVLEPEFLDWARDAFVAGRVDQGQIQLSGDPAAFPFDTQPDAGSFAMQLSVSGVELNYGDGWPSLKSVNGSVSGSGNDLQISTSSGQIAGFAFAGVDANIDNLINGMPELTVNGLLNGEAQQGLNFLKNSPLASRFGPIADWLTLTGNTQLKLGLNVPLLDPDATQVQGEIALQENQLLIEGLPDLTFEQLGGQINFDNDGLSAEQLNAQVAGEPAVVSIEPQAENTRIQLNSAFNVSQLASVWQLDLPAGISGRSSVQANVDVAETQPGDFTVEVSVNSDLQGVIIDFPEPFNKPPAQSLPLTLNLSPEQEKLTFDLQLADWLTAKAAITGDDLRAAVSLGSQPAVLPASGIRVVGQLQTLSISEWQKWWQQNVNSDTDRNWQIDTADLRFDQLLWNSFELNDVAVNVLRQPVVWQIKIAAQQLKGDINWPASGDSLPTLHFDFVDLPLPSNVIDDKGIASRPALWPGFELNIDNLTLDDMKLGRLQARAVRDPLRWQLVSASLQSPTLQASASGDWRRNDDGDNTQLTLQLNSDDLANLLVDLGYQPAISARRVSVDGNFTWPDAPLNFDRRDFLGQMQLDVGSGQLKDVEPGAAGRIFGLFSFTAIPRRLALDFSDLFGSGFGFKSISGRFDFANGLATTNNLQMRGDSALVTVTGPINLVERTYNQTVHITPNVASTLPLAGAVAGGPIGLGVGTAIFIVDKLASNLFDKELVDIITYRYQLTGPWDAPEMKLQTAEQP